MKKNVKMFCLDAFFDLLMGFLQSKLGKGAILSKDQKTYVNRKMFKKGGISIVTFSWQGLENDAKSRKKQHHA